MLFFTYNFILMQDNIVNTVNTLDKTINHFKLNKIKSFKLFRNLIRTKLL